MKKIILSLILLFNVFCVFATGINKVYWRMPYDKLMFEKQVVEGSAFFEDESFKILQENKNSESIYYLFRKYDNKLISIIINTKKDYKYIKNRTDAQAYFSNLNYTREFLSNLSIQWGYISSEEIIPYFVLLKECDNYFSTDGSSYFNSMKEKNIQKADAKSSVTIYQSTPETKAFVFENVIENENFIILLPSSE